MLSKVPNSLFIKICFFTILFIALTKVLLNFQLNGISDNGHYISFISNMYNYLSFNVSMDGGYNYLGGHFSPFWIFFSPLLYFIDSPIYLLYIMFYVGYLLIYLSLIYVIELNFNRKVRIIENIIIFLALFSSVTILFNYSLNFNGIHEVLFAVPFIIISMYYLFNTQQYQKILFWYYPTLLIKEEFWLLIIFVYLAIFIKTINYKYLIGLVLHLFLFYVLYFHIMKYLYIESLDEHINISGALSSFYAYLFNSNSINEIVNSILNLSHMKKRILLIISFFIPFVFLIRWNKILFKDIVLFGILVLPTIGYTFLSKHYGMTNLLFDHYSLPIIGVLFVFTLKYLNLSKIRIFFYLCSNILLLLLILYNKQPWQYKYYQDESQLINDIKPILNVSHNDFFVTDDRTGVYFSYQNMDAILNKPDHRIPKYVVINFRYMYYTHYLNNTSIHSNSSSRYFIKKNQYLNKYNYGIIYFKYPFMVYEKDAKSDFKYEKDILDKWDKRTIDSNKWFN